MRWGVAALTAIVAAVPVRATADPGVTALAGGLMWHNRGNGEVSMWRPNGSGTVLGQQTLNWRCSYEGSCIDFGAVGVGDLNNDGNQDLVWRNWYTGEVRTWLLNGSGIVLGTQSVDWRCAYSTGCSQSWYIIGIADVNNDGRQDLAWYNRTSGEVSSWLLNGYGNVITTQVVDWRCSTGSGCSPAWRPVAIGDLNNDGRQDLTWYHAASGEVSTWLLNGAGTVVAKQALDWRCDIPSGCANQWRVVDLVG